MLSDTKDNYVFKNSLYMCFLTLFTKHLKKKIFYFWLSSFYFLIFNFYNRFIMNFIRETDVRQVIRDALVLLFTVQTYIFCTILELDSNEHPMVRLTNCLQMKLYVTPLYMCLPLLQYYFLVVRPAVGARIGKIRSSWKMNEHARPVVIEALARWCVLRYKVGFEILFTNFKNWKTNKYEVYGINSFTSKLFQANK